MYKHVIPSEVFLFCRRYLSDEVALEDYTGSSVATGRASLAGQAKGKKLD